MPKANSKLHILMLTEYFYPHDRGGSEWSTHFLAQSLIKLGHSVSLLTPNYGSSPRQRWRHIDIHRFRIGKKLSPQSSSATPFWHTNLYWWLSSTFKLLQVVSLTQPHVIHVQGKYFLPAAVIVSKIKGIPVVFTARDYHLICNLGFCLWHKNSACNLQEFLTQDIATYNLHYHRPRLLKPFFPLFHLYHRAISRLLKFFCRQVDAIVCISQAQQRIFHRNGLTNTQIIYNSVTFPRQAKARKKNQLIFIGRLTPGKGADLLVPSLASASPRSSKLIIVGSGFLDSKIRRQIKQHHLSSRINLTGQLSHSRTMKILRQSQAAIFPSRWPEPFGRGALEALAQGTPAIVSNRGGLPEIITSRYGVIIAPTVKHLSAAIDSILSRQASLSRHIQTDRHRLIHKFTTHPVTQYQRLYYQLKP